MSSDDFDTDQQSTGGYELEARAGLRRVSGLSTELEDVTEVEYRQIRLEQVVLVGVWTEGTADQAVDPASADVLYAHLLTRGRQPVYDRVEDADHSFAFSDKGRPHGWPELYGRIVEWFLKPPE